MPKGETVGNVVIDGKGVGKEAAEKAVDKEKRQARKLMKQILYERALISIRTCMRTSDV